MNMQLYYSKSEGWRWHKKCRICGKKFWTSFLFDWVCLLCRLKESDSITKESIRYHLKKGE